MGNDSIDAISASASRDNNGFVHISLVNIDAKKPQFIKITLEGGTYKNVTARILQSGKLQDHNTFENPETVIPKSFSYIKLISNKLEIKLPPFSVVVLELK